MRFRARSNVVVGPGFLIRLRLAFREHFNSQCPVRCDLHFAACIPRVSGTAKDARNVGLGESRFSCHPAIIAVLRDEGKKKGRKSSRPGTAKQRGPNMLTVPLTSFVCVPIGDTA